MPENTAPPRSVAGRGGAPPLDPTSISDDLSQILPLRLLRSQLIPPAPNRRESAVDWLPELFGFSWIAYGASSLLVIAHCPSPVPPVEAEVGPFFQQVIEPPRDGDWSAEAKAVRWCPVRPSDGVVAVGLGNCVRLYKPDAEDAVLGSLSWKQIVGLMQSFEVEAIEWTGSGDGLITVGVEVVLWKRNIASWEVAHKVRADVPQSLVSSTWSIDGPVAAAATVDPSAHACSKNGEVLSPLFGVSSRHVLVCHDHGKSGFLKVDLCHPQPVSMIQWRPFSLSWSKKNSLYLQRDVLLTCCLDGVVRLWSEIDGSRAKKSTKDTDDQKTVRSYHVIAVIEINQCLKATLGKDTFISWVVEVHSAFHLGDGDKCFQAESSDYNPIGHCEWLVSVGPGSSLSFWAIHCLEDVSPIRFPRVCLWKKCHLKYINKRNLPVADSSYSGGLPLLIKAVVSRNQLSGPPLTCLLLMLSPNNSVSWLLLDSLASVTAEDGSPSLPICEESSSCFLHEVQSQDGHKGTIIQIAVHPSSCEVELAVSLDSDGLLLFWSSIVISTCNLSMETLYTPAWKLLGRIDLQEICTVVYSNLTWMPCVFNKDRFLLMGHAEGIDCFLIKLSDEESEFFVCHRTFTIPFSSHCSKSGPYHIFTTPLASTCEHSFGFNKFMLFAIWTTEFHALSWEVTMHSDDLTGSTCSCSPDAADAVSSDHKYEHSYDSRAYHLTANLCPSNFPFSYSTDRVTSFAVVSPNYLVPSIKSLTSSSGTCGTSPLYHIITGFCDGSLRIWRIPTLSSSVQISGTKDLPWELVGMLSAHKGPVNAISLSSCGTKLATSCTSGPNSTVMLHIWGSMSLVSGGCFLLEDKIHLNEVAISMSWLALGNGQLLLGVCMENELHIYSQKRFVDPMLVKAGKFLETSNWFCIAVCHTKPITKDFLWGPKVSPMLVHEKHFSFFSHWSTRTDMTTQENLHFRVKEYCPTISIGERDEDLVECVSSDFSKFHFNESETHDNSDSCQPMQLLNSDIKNSNGVEKLCTSTSRQLFSVDSNIGLHSMLKIVDNLCGSLALYHPQALLRYLYSGNLKRAYIAVDQLVRHLRSCSTSNDESGKSHPINPEISLAQYFQKTFPTTTQSEGIEWGYDFLAEISDMQFKGHFFHVPEESSLPNSCRSIPGFSSQKSEIKSFIDTLENSNDISPPSNLERIQILSVLELLDECIDPHYSSAYESFDEPGRRFWVAVRFQHFYFLRKFGRLALAAELVAEPWMVAWALQSDCQDNLYNSLLPPESSWVEMRSMGVGYWFTNATQLRQKMEKLARLQYLLKKDPKDCALLYLALNRLQVLSGLFRISKNEKDKPLVGFLSRNFQEEKNKAAALKNAYVLLGRHQLELAAAFFLLGGNPSSAVTICAKNLGDEQLALVICRLVEGYGGSLERHLISTVLLPNAVDKKDYWLSSMFEWMLGNYLQSYKTLAGSCLHLAIDNLDIPCNRAGFFDPSVGQYCMMLASKNHLRSSVGDHMSAVLSKWAALATGSALIRCGFPLEALEYMPSSFSNLEVKDQSHSLVSEKHRSLHENLNPFSSDGCNWLLIDVANHLEYNSCLNTAMQYSSKLAQEYPGWPNSNLVSSSMLQKKQDNHQDELQINNFNAKMKMSISILQEKYYLKSTDIINMILMSSNSNDLLILGYNLLHELISCEHVSDNHPTVGRFDLLPIISSMLTKACKEICYYLARYTSYHSVTDSLLIMNGKYVYSSQSDSSHFFFKRLTLSIRSLRDLLNHYALGILKADNCSKTFAVLDYLELCIYFASAWSGRKLNELVLMIHPIANDLNKKQSFQEAIGGNMSHFLSQPSGAVQYLSRNFCNADPKQKQNEESGLFLFHLENEKWKLIGVSLWKQLYDFIKDQLSLLVTANLEDATSKTKPVEMFPFFFSELLCSALAYAFSALNKQLASWILQKVENGYPVDTLFQLEELTYSETSSSSYSFNAESDTLKPMSNENQKFLFKVLLEISLDSEEICAGLYEKINHFASARKKSSCFWNDIQSVITNQYRGQNTANSTQDFGMGATETRDEEVLVSSGPSLDKETTTGAGTKDLSPFKAGTYFDIPKEVYKKSGELIEALCFNCIEEQQVALATNRRGIIFLNLAGEEHTRDQLQYIWSDYDWPRDGWAGSEPTPVPTFVSQGIGLGSKKGSHLGLGGATIGTSSLARPGRDLTGGGAFGIPGYAGIGASGLGWSEKEDFEFMDPPATIQNISTRALCSHPSKPLFLVGSCNTHVYLWEFGKDRATATYGVVPAANVSPPYALASISGLQFDRYGHRFATAALDGTICTWQLEVGGRSNVHPTESSLCFNNHASDVAYMGVSGSIIAAAGYGTNDANAIIWDTLAPPASSQAFLICHEGGARSLSVLDNGRGGGSVSPVIITGGENGDVGLHDFRYIATGRTKRHRHSSEKFSQSSAIQDTNTLPSRSGENVNGMLWHIPKAHLGSVTRISAIPNTSLFLTGGKDGDVKLWDAKRSELVFHWQKLHERHTFLQPSSRGFGRVVRAAVTDVQVISHGFLTCGGDGTVKRVQLNDFPC